MLNVLELLGLLKKHGYASRINVQEARRSIKLPARYPQMPSPNKSCQLNRWTQHRPVHSFGNAFAREPSVELYSAETQPGQLSGWSNPSERFWLLFSLQGGFELSVALTH
jgi:hypothetical protein